VSQQEQSIGVSQQDQSIGVRRPIAVVVPGPIAQATGGYRYMAALAQALAALGAPVRVIELPGRFPDPDHVARAAARRIGDDADLVIDGLAALAFADLPVLTRAVVLLHHPLHLETGLDRQARQHLFAAEAAVVTQAQRVIVTSPATLPDALDLGVHPERLAVALPGTDRPRGLKIRRRGPLRLLTVATVVPRKDHLTLIRALDRLHCPWRWCALGNDQRDRGHRARVVSAIRQARSTRRLRLAGEVSAATLALTYRMTDLFVLPSRHEGYGMAFAEALAAGLPVVAAAAGAVPLTVPRSAGVLARPGDPKAFARALKRAIRSRRRLMRGARIAGARQPDWLAAARVVLGSWA
jgi:glycosyltransferase involved in cell wall biosynthesis